MIPDMLMLPFLRPHARQAPTESTQHCRGSPWQKWICEEITNGAAVAKRQRLRSPLSSLGLCQQVASVSIMFKSPTLHFQALRSSELASGHLCLCHPHSSLGCQDYDLLLWPAPSTAPTVSHKQTSKAFLMQRALHLLRAPGAAELPLHSGLIQFLFINSLDEYVI